MSAELLKETVEFVWLDDQGVIMSPVHRTLGAALGFADEWGLNWRRLTRLIESRAETVRREVEDGGHASYAKSQVDKAQRAREKLSKTGRAPAALRRHITTVTVDDLIDSEAEAARIVLAQSDLRMDHDA